MRVKIYCLDLKETTPQCLISLMSSIQGLAIMTGKSVMLCLDDVS